MTHNEKIVEAVATAICQEVNPVRFADLPEAATYIERKTHVDRPILDKGEARDVARAAITAYQAEAWQDNLDCMPFGEDFLAENRFGDWLTVRRFDPKKPGDYSGNAVINGRTGRWWHPTRWRPLLPLPNPPASP